MDKLITTLGTLKALLLRITEVLGLFVALIVLVYLLMGEASGPFIIGVVTNVILLVGAVTPQTLVAIALVIGLYVAFRARKP